MRLTEPSCACWLLIVSVESFQHHLHQDVSPSSQSAQNHHRSFHLFASADPGTAQEDTPIFDSNYYMPADGSISRGASPLPGGRRITLTRFLSQFVKDHPEYKTLKNIYLAVQMACKTISRLVNRAGLVLDTTTTFTGDDDNQDDYSDGRFYSMKRLDKLSTTVMKNALKFTGTVQMVAPQAKMDSERPEEHQPGVLIAYDKNHLACLDPMDGSGNADAVRIIVLLSLYAAHHFLII